MRFRASLILCFAPLLLASCGGQDQAEASVKEASTALPTMGGKTQYARVDGTLSATVNGAQRKWYFTHTGRGENYDSRSYWLKTAGKSANVELMAHPKHTIEFEGRGEIGLSFIVDDIHSDGQAMLPKLTYFPGGKVNLWSSENGGESNVTLSSVRLVDDQLILSGTFSGIVPIDPDNDKDLPEHMQRFEIENGEFEVRVTKSN